jgi:hypothetical protein
MVQRIVNYRSDTLVLTKLREVYVTRIEIKITSNIPDGNSCPL